MPARASPTAAATASTSARSAHSCRTFHDVDVERGAREAYDALQRARFDHARSRAKVHSPEAAALLREAGTSTPSCGGSARPSRNAGAAARTLHARTRRRPLPASSAQHCNRFFGSEAVGTYCNHPVEGLRHLTCATPPRGTPTGELQPQLIIQPAAQPHVDWCEDHAPESHEINVAGTRNVALRRAGRRAYVFFSTDYVFKGDSGPYREMQPQPPTSTATTSWSEQIIADTLDGLPHRASVWRLRRRTTRQELRDGLLARPAREPMNVPPISGATRLRRQPGAGRTGIGARRIAGSITIVGRSIWTVVSFARLACVVFGLDSSFVRARTTAELGQRAPRPLRGGLDTRRRAVLSTELLAPRQDWS